MNKKLLVYLLSIAVAFFIVGCGGGGGGGSSSAGATPQKVVSHNIQAPEANVFTKQTSWELSHEGAPEYALSTEGTISDFSTTVYPSHPRLYFRDTDEAYLRAKMSSQEWANFKEVVTTRLDNKTTAEAIALLNSYEAGDAEYAKMMAFLAFMERDSYYINLTIAWALDLASRTPENSDGDILLRRRIERLAEIYDWLHDDLTAQERTTIRAGLKVHVDQLLSFDYMSTTINYIQKHSRWGHGVVAQALLAMYGDFDTEFTKAYADTLLSETRENLRKYAEAESYIAADGGWHLGWGYAYFNANYTFNYLIWSTATNETMLDDWMGDLTYWYLYALRADKTLPQTGDATISDIGYGVLAALYQAKMKNDGFAKWYVEENAKTSFGDLFTRFIMKEDTVVAKNPNVLPTSRNFEQVGTVVARDTWDLEDATLFIFKSSPFYNAGHHHRDENSFTIDYKTSLALDTGFYDETDSPHYKNYYVRTIAHNAITVYNPNQVMQYITDYNEAWTDQEKLLVNDGGQIYKDPDSMEKADIVEGAANRLGGITKYQRNDNYTYAVGDATKAYDPMTVSLAKREVMYVQDSGYAHPVILVLDKIEATSSSYQKRYLLHTEPDSAPVVSGKTMTVVSTGSKGSAKMVNKTLYPTNATLTSIGGAGHEYQLMDRTSPEPVASGIVNEIKADNNTKSGTWRLEVSPPTGNMYDVMLNAIFVGDGSENIDTEKALLVDSGNGVGVQLPNRVVVFSKDKEDAAVPIEYSVAQDSNIQHTVVTGFSGGESVKVSVNGVENSGFIVGEGGCVDFKLDAKTTDVIKVSR